MIDDSTFILIKQVDLNTHLKLHPNFNILIYPVDYKKSTWWKIVFSFSCNTKKHLLLNKVGKVRLFKKIESIVNFINEHCPETSKFSVFLQKK